MKNIAKKLFALLCAAALALPVFAACDSGESGSGSGNGGGSGTPSVTEQVDYASQLKLDMNSETKKQEVTVKFFIDGDTTHFTPLSNKTEFIDGLIKARYLAVNTPESTGVVEKWGKTASNFTHEKLEGAEKIIVESDDNKWNVDSTGERYLLWIWYIPEGKEIKDENYRNLNVELLQEGYGRSSKTSDNRYGETAGAALYQAQQLKLNIYGNKVDPNYFGGEAEQLTLKYLRFHVAEYVQHPVRVQGLVTARYGNSVYIEEYDEETGVSYGIAVYYGFKTGQLLDILKTGNMVDVIGTVGEFNGTYQISDVDYNEARPNLPDNTQLLSSGNTVTPTEVSIDDLAPNATRKVTAEFATVDEDGEETLESMTIDYGTAIMDTLVTVKDLEITDLYSTKKDASDGSRVPTGQISVTVKVKGETGSSLVLRTEAMYKEDGKTLYAESDFKNGTANKSLASAKGIVDYYNGTYQISIWSWDCFAFAS